MLLIDDILLAPLRGLLWTARKVHDAAQQESDSEAESITAQLCELNRMLEMGGIAEKEFEAQEAVLLDRLDRIEQDCQPAKARGVSTGR